MINRGISLATSVTIGASSDEVDNGHHTSREAVIDNV